MTTNVLTQISSKVTMVSRFLVIVVFLAPSDQTIWLPHQNVQDPSTWTLPHLLQLKQEYNNLQIKYVLYRNRMWSKIRQLPLRTLSYYHPSLAFIRPIHAIGSCLRRGNKEQDLEPRPYSNIEHPSVLTHEMMTIEPGENPSRNLMWKPRVWFSHIMCRSHDDRLPMSVWETSFYSTLGVPISD